MARLELYKPVHSMQVTGFTHEEVQGMPVSAKATPFKEGHIPQFSVVSVNGNGNGADESSQLRLISKIHGRSYEYVTGKENALFWTDEYGNIFGALNTKGNNCNEPALQRDDVTPSGYRIYGMQDSDSMVRVLRASDMLRANHIDTEAIVKVIEPAEVPINGEVVPLDELKRRFALGAWNNGFGAQEVTTIAQVLSNMTCFITIRGVQVNERMADLREAGNYAAFVPLIKNAFRYVNLAEEAKAAQNAGYTADHFSIEDPNDIKRYFTDYLPGRIAENYAQLHKLGLIHIFPHSGNISITGGIQLKSSTQSEREEDIPMDIVMDVVGNFLENLDFLVFASTDPLKRAAYFGLLFEEPPTYQELVFGTPKLAPYIKLIQSSGGTKSGLARPA